MSDAIIAIFCTLMLAAGWYYLTRSQAVAQLQGLETPLRNATRRRARRLGAWSLIIIGLSTFWLVWEVQRWQPGNRAGSARSVFAIAVVAFALLVFVLSAVVDVYLTLRLRQSNRPPKP